METLLTPNFVKALLVHVAFRCSQDSIPKPHSFTTSPLYTGAVPASRGSTNMIAAWYNESSLSNPTKLYSIVHCPLGNNVYDDINTTQVVIWRYLL